MTSTPPRPSFQLLLHQALCNIPLESYKTSGLIFTKYNLPNKKRSESRFAWLLSVIMHVFMHGLYFCVCWLGIMCHTQLKIQQDSALQRSGSPVGVATCSTQTDTDPLLRGRPWLRNISGALPHKTTKWWRQREAEAKEGQIKQEEMQIKYAQSYRHR